MNKIAFSAIVALLMLLPMTAEAADPNFALAISTVDTRYEIRGGAEWEYLGLYLSPSYNVTTNDLGVRLYGTYSAINADMVANWLGSEHPLPEGNLYGGVFGGWKSRGDQMEAGLLAGVRIAIDDRLESYTEWQYNFTRFAEDGDGYALITGLHYRLN